MNINYLENLIELLSDKLYIIRSSIKKTEKNKSIIDKQKKDKDIKIFFDKCFYTIICVGLLDFFIENPTFINLGIISPTTLTTILIVSQSLSLHNNIFKIKKLLKKSIIKDEDVKKKDIELQIENKLLIEKEKIISTLESTINDITDTVSYLSEDYQINYKNNKTSVTITDEITTLKENLNAKVTSLEENISKKVLLENVEESFSSLNLLSIFAAYGSSSLFTSLTYAKSSLETNFSTDGIIKLLIINLIATGAYISSFAVLANNDSKVKSQVVQKISMEKNLEITEHDLKIKSIKQIELEQKIEDLSNEISDIEMKIMFLEEQKNSLKKYKYLDISPITEDTLDIILSKNKKY